MKTAYQILIDKVEQAKTEDEFDSVRMRAFKQKEVGTINLDQYKEILETIEVREIFADFISKENSKWKTNTLCTL